MAQQTVSGGKAGEKFTHRRKLRQVADPKIKAAKKVAGKKAAAQKTTSAQAKKSNATSTVPNTRKRSRRATKRSHNGSY